MNAEPRSFFDRLNAYVRRSATIKLLGVAFLALILMIPVALIDDLIRERQNLRDSAVEEISSTWGGRQELAGPVLQVPYTERVTRTDSDGRFVTTTNKGSAYFLPEDLQLDASVVSEERYRGIYVAVLYTGAARIEARFDSLALDRLDVPANLLDWSKASLSFGVTDLRGIDSLSRLLINGRSVGFEPSVPAQGVLRSGFQAPLNLSGPLAAGSRISFDLTFRGSTALNFAPYAASTDVTLTGDWADPKFLGAFLPDEREVSSDGFSASWNVLEVNRPFAQEGTSNTSGALQSTAAMDYNDDYYYESRTVSNQFSSSSMGAYSFGTQFLLAVDDYRKIQRSAKYSALFVAATFLTFFFIEVLNRRRVHPVQYLLIGFGVVLFYILLISLSEHIGFEWSYLIGAGLTVATIGGYSAAVLRNRKLTLLVVGLLIVLYTFFYSILQLQDYSLLLGSAGLLISLATVMYLTRKTDWYNLGEEE